VLRKDSASDETLEATWVDEAFRFTTEPESEELLGPVAFLEMAVEFANLAVVEFRNRAELLPTTTCVCVVIMVAIFVTTDDFRAVTVPVVVGVALVIPKHEQADG
jgi:hypothetical protein